MIEFYAYLPPIQSALMLDGAGDNLQVKFNIPLRLSPDGIRLAGMTGKRLKVTVEEVEDGREQEVGKAMEVGTERKSEWSSAEGTHLDQPAGESGQSQDTCERSGETPLGNPVGDDLAGIDVGCCYPAGRNEETYPLPD